MATYESTDLLFERYGPKYRWLVTFFGLSGAFAMVLSATIANVAVPHAMGAFGIDQDQAQWMATAFLATMTVSQLLNHWMIEAFGQRGAYSLTIVVFLVGTVIAWYAPNIDILIVGRILQGFSAGIISPLVMVTMFLVFPPDQRGLAMGIYGAGLVLAPAIGPAVGGMAIDTFHWRYIFIMPLPFCVIGLIGSAIFLPTRSHSGGLPPFDWIGYLLLGAAVVGLFSATANGVRWGWGSNEILLLLTLGVAAGATFVLWQLRATSPLIDFSLWRYQRFTAALLVAFVFGAGNFASSYVIPVFVQQVQGYSATAAGFVILPAGVMLVCVLPLTGRIADILPAHIPIMIGLLFFAAGTVLMSNADVNTPFWTFALFACVTRFGLAFMIPSLSVGALQAIPADQLTRGSGNINFVRQLGGAMGTNLVVVWLTIRTSFHTDAITATQTAANEASREFLNRIGIELGQLVSGDVQQAVALDFLGRVIHAQAQTFGFKDCFLALAVVFVLALIPTWIFSRAR